MRDNYGKYIGDKFDCECGFTGDLDEMDVRCKRIDSKTDKDKFEFTLLCPNCGTDEIGTYDAWGEE